MRHHPFTRHGRTHCRRTHYMRRLKRRNGSLHPALLLRHLRHPHRHHRYLKNDDHHRLLRPCRLLQSIWRFVLWQQPATILRHGEASASITTSWCSRKLIAPLRDSTLVGRPREH